MDYKQKAISNLKEPTMQNASQDLNNPVSKNREFTVNSETIVSFVLEKLISLAITDAKRKEIEAEIPSKCFSYVTNMINNFIKSEYLPYDRDDRYILLPNRKKKQNNPDSNSNKDLANLNSVNANNNLNYDNKKHNVNYANAEKMNDSQNNFMNKSLSANEEMIDQLQNDDSSMEVDEDNKKILTEDAYAENEFLKTNDNLSNLNLEENFGYFFDNRIFGVNDWTICDEPFSSKIDRSATSMIKTIKPPNKEGGKEKEEDKHSSQHSDTMGRTKHKFHPVKNSTKIIIEENNKPHHHPREEILQYKLTNLEEFTEDTFIKKTRLDKEKQLKKEEEEKKMKKIQEKEINEKNIEMMKKLKENQNKHFTTDVNGNILLIKGTGVDRLQGEFFFPKLNILEKATIPPSNLNTNAAKYEKKDTPNSRIPSSKSKLFQKLPMAKGLGFIENANPTNTNIVNFLVNTNNTLMNTNANSNNNIVKNADADRLVSILPAGSSFDLIAPEVGVTIIEGDKQKSGGKDYLKHFKKYSKYDYTKLVRDTMNTNMTNSTATAANNKLQSRASIRTDGLTKFSDYSNLKMNNTVSGFGMTKEISEEDFLDMEDLKDEKGFKSGIKLNTKYGTSLRTAIEKLDLIPEFEESEMDGENGKKLNNTDLFKKPETSKNRKLNPKKNNLGANENNKTDNNYNKLNNNNNEDLEEINKFNNAIMKNANWGKAGKPSASEENAKNSLFHKPYKKEIEREIGKSIYNTKLPRARLLTKIKDPESNSFSKLANKTGGAFGASANSKFFGENTLYNNSTFNKTAFDDKAFLRK